MKLLTIWMHKLGHDVKANEYVKETSLSPVPLDTVLYFFTRAAVVSKRLVIDAPWLDPGIVQSQQIYARTATGVYETQLRSFPELEKQLPSDMFIRSHQSLMINIAKIAKLALTGKLKQVGFNGNVRLEWLAVSRGLHTKVRQALGLPRTRYTKSKV